MTECKYCHRLIIWNDGQHAYVNARHFGDEVIPQTIDGNLIRHNDTCPTRIKERIERHCIWCRLENGEDIIRLRSLFDYMKCDKHADENIDVQYRGQTLKRNRTTLALMYKDAISETRRRERRIKKAAGSMSLDSLLK